MQNIIPNTFLLKTTAIPEHAYYPSRQRYRADSIIRWLKNKYMKDTIVAGLINMDISTTIGHYNDWGVMGLGYRPGNACIISTFRLAKDNKEDQLYKVVLHELGHTQGLSHCPDDNCYMRDAEGGNHLNKEKQFCTKCAAYLKSVGWYL